MAWDKVTKVDSIAKRKAWTKSNLGKYVEYSDTFTLVSESGKDYASWSPIRGNTAGQALVTLSKRGRLHRRVSHGVGGIATSWPRQ